jgi:shikimate dehydrogenase
MTAEIHIPSGRTLVYPMIGHPVTQVKSPTTFNRYFTQNRINSVMFAMDIAPDRVACFFSLLRAWENCPGCVITIPFKQEAARQAEELSPRARYLGAANVMRRTKEGKLIADMVDGVGFLAALSWNGFNVMGRRALVFGAGGAGGAIAYSIAEAGAAALAVVDTDRGRQDHLLSLISGQFPSIFLTHEVHSLAGFDLIVNATPLGMNGDTRVPFPLASLQPATFVADVVTDPDITPWLAEAQKRGCPIQTGYEMTLGQFVTMARHMGIAIEKTGIDEIISGKH